MPRADKPEPESAGWTLRQRLIVGAAAASGFFAGAVLCLAACYALLFACASALPRRAEANESFAQVPAFLCGGALSVVLALGAGFASALWASARAGRLLHHFDPAQPVDEPE
jgi:uncharacterized membrane protein YedE/YeeE